MNKNLICPVESPFRILVIADIQENKVLSENYLKLLSDAIQKTKPQLIVLLGDMIFGPVMLSQKKVERVIVSLLNLLNQAQIPFTFVFGNHDLDSVMSSQKQINLYRTSPYCLTPSFEERSCSQAYSLDVLSHENNKLFSLLFFDSGATSLSRYGISYEGPGVEANAWIKNYLQTDNTPCFIFQHVPVLSIYELLTISDSKTEGSIKGRGMYHGKWLSLSEKAKGILGESPCPQWQKEDLQFASWRGNDRIKAAIFGHDHKNCFSGTLGGIDILQTPCAGLNCYGNDEVRGFRLLDINPDGTYTSQNLFIESLKEK